MQCIWALEGQGKGEIIYSLSRKSPKYLPMRFGSILIYDVAFILFKYSD